MEDMERSSFLKTHRSIEHTDKCQTCFCSARRFLYKILTGLFEVLCMKQCEILPNIRFLHHDNTPVVYGKKICCQVMKLLLIT